MPRLLEHYNLNLVDRGKKLQVGFAVREEWRGLIEELVDEGINVKLHNLK